MTNNNDKKIIQYFIKTKNKPEYASMVGRSTGIKEGTAIDRCKILKDAGTLSSKDYHVYRSGVQPHYFLSESIKTLRIIKESLPPEDLVEMMELDYYINQIPEIINSFDAKLKTQCNKSLSDFDKKLLPYYLKHTVSGLEFIFNDCDYNAHIFNQKYQSSFDYLDFFYDGAKFGSESVISRLDQATRNEVRIKHAAELHGEAMDIMFSEIRECFIIIDLFARFLSHDVLLGRLKYLDEPYDGYNQIEIEAEPYDEYNRSEKEAEVDAYMRDPKIKEYLGDKQIIDHICIEKKNAMIEEAIRVNERIYRNTIYL